MNTSDSQVGYSQSMQRVQTIDPDIHVVTTKAKKDKATPHSSSSSSKSDSPLANEKAFEKI